MESNDQLIPSQTQTLRRAQDWPQIHWRANSNALSSLSWEQVMRVLRKHRWFLIVTIVGLTLATAGAAFLMRDVYQPTARVEIDPMGGSAKALQEIENPSSQGDLDYLDTQVQILQGDGLAMRVIRKLHLDGNNEFVDKKEFAEARAS